MRFVVAFALLVAISAPPVIWLADQEGKRQAAIYDEINAAFERALR